MDMTKVPTIPAHEIPGYWMGDDDEVCRDASQLPEEVWKAIVMDSVQYGSDRIMGECEHLDGEINKLPYPTCECSKDTFVRNDHYLWEGLMFAGFVANAEPNKYGDLWVVAYCYSTKGFGALVGVSADMAVSCYAN